MSLVLSLFIEAMACKRRALTIRKRSHSAPGVLCVRRSEKRNNRAGQPPTSHGSNTRSSAASSSDSTGRILPSPQGSTKDDVVSKYLVVPGFSTPSVPKIHVVPPHARLLTSTEAIAILEEKERKKQQEAAEKEQRKKEREEKKMQREEERKKKAEERARKAEEKAQEKARKAEERARKAEEKARKVAENAKNASEKSKAGTKRKIKEKAGSAESPSTSGETQPPQHKKARTEAMQQVHNINDSECCMCFTTYEEDLRDQSDKDWVACACGRWLHEDCAEDCVVDDEGKERLCHFCLDVLA